MDSPDLLARRETHFILWRVTNPAPVPVLVIGEFQPGNPPVVSNIARFPLRLSAGFTDLWEVSAADCQLTDGKVYHYWFEVSDVTPGRTPGTRIRITDPAAFAVDWRVRGPALPPPYHDDDRYPAAVIKFCAGKLVAADPGGETGDWQGETAAPRLAPNNRLVIYELPTAWTRMGSDGLLERAVGTFEDALALVDANHAGANFSDLEILEIGHSYLSELGINALELLPPADSFYRREWGYGTTNYFAPDFDLGFPEENSSPTAIRDLVTLVRACHAKGIRFFVDSVMAFAKQHGYRAAAGEDFFIENPGADLNDPDALTSGRHGGKEVRNGFGSTLFRYARFLDGYDPVSGSKSSISPGRQLMKAAVAYWIEHFHIDGIRLDSVENIANWDFVQEYKNYAREFWKTRFQHSGADPDAHFLVVGEELDEPLDLLTQKRLDGLWHINFRRYIRSALLGRNAEAEPSFEWTVRKAIDCRHFGYTDGAQAVLYLTSHDVEGFQAERLFNFFNNNGIWETERRIKLAFACLLTAVGIPMILAGDEFADEHDRFDHNGHVTQDGGKQTDPVNYSRLKDDWRARIKEYVSRLVKLRTSYDALSINDTTFLHVDFNDSKRVLVWQRGIPATGSCVVVVANFSDFTTANATSPAAEYKVPNWPVTPPGKTWREMTQDRAVPFEWVDREPIYAWEAKVFAMV